MFGNLFGHALAIVALFAVLATGQVQNRQQCSFESAGEIKTGNINDVKEVTVRVLKHHQRAAVFRVPNACGEFGMGLQQIGVVVKACDSDLPPDVALYGQNGGRVERRGRLKSSAVVTALVFCKYTSGPRGVQPAQPQECDCDCESRNAKDSSEFQL